MHRKKDTISTVFALLALLCLFLPGFIYFKKMRIVASASISAGTCLGVFFYVFLAVSIVLVLIQLAGNRLWKHLIQALLAGVCIAGMFLAVSYALQWLPLEKTEYSRLSIGPSMWLWLACMCSLIIRSSELTRQPWLRLVYGAVPTILRLGLLFSGLLNGLAIMKEYETYKDQFWQAAAYHITASAWIMLIGTVIGIPLGFFANRNKTLERVMFSVLNVTETIPGTSFIGIMIIPLAFLAKNFPILKAMGIRGYGIVPVAIVLVIYAIYPIVHNTRAAFETIDEFYYEVAEALGMSKLRMFFSVQIPMVLPTVLAGIRIALVHTIGGMSLGALIGGGGLGRYMFQTESMDMVLLGAIPVVIMTFVADKGLRAVAALIPGGRKVK